MGSLFLCLGVIYLLVTLLPLLSAPLWHMCCLYEQPSIAGVPDLHDLMPDDLRCSWCNNNRNKVHNTCNVLGSAPSHPPPLPSPRQSCLPQNQSLVPKLLGAASLQYLRSPDRCTSVSSSTNSKSKQGGTKFRIQSAHTTHRPSVLSSSVFIPLPHPALSMIPECSECSKVIWSWPTHKPLPALQATSALYGLMETPPATGGPRIPRTSLGCRDAGGRGSLLAGQVTAHVPSRRLRLQNTCFLQLQRWAKTCPSLPRTLLSILARSRADQGKMTGGKGPWQPFQLKDTVKGAAASFLNVYSWPLNNMLSLEALTPHAVKTPHATSRRPCDPQLSTHRIYQQQIASYCNIYYWKKIHLEVDPHPWSSNSAKGQLQLWPLPFPVLSFFLCKIK